MADRGDGKIEAVFQRATDYVRGIAGSLEQEKLLYFYARYKQANEGPCKTQRPGFFDFQGKQKWDAWNALGDKDKNTAMVEYVTELSNIDPKWEEEEGMTTSQTGMGVAVSTMTCNDSFIPDTQKTVFDWLKEDNINKVSKILRKCDVNLKDAEGMALLHWACDRGLEDMARLLLTSSADVNIKDADGQTPLHYAVSCEHTQVIQLLMEHGADTSLKDHDGNTPADSSENANLLQLLKHSTS